MRGRWVIVAGAVAIGGCGAVATEPTPFGIDGVLAPMPDAGRDAAPTIAKTDATTNGREEVVTTPPPDDATLKAACSAIVDATCSVDTRACCVSKGVGWDDIGCRTKAMSACNDIIAAVDAGLRGYDGSKLSDCLARWHGIGATCDVARSDALHTLMACDLVFPSTTPPPYRRVCARDADCPPYADAVGFCEKRAHYGDDQCAWLAIGPGIESAYWQDILPVCSPGESLCSAYTAGPPHSRCAPDLSVGSDCGWAIPGCCGSDSYCDSTVHRCSPRKPLGAACDNDCISWNCSCGAPDPWSACTSSTFTCAPGSPYSPYTSIALAELCSGADGSIAVALVDWRVLR